MKFVFDEGLVGVTYDSLAYKGQSDFYRRPFMQTFGFGVYYTISQLMSRLGALRESDFDLHIQQYEEKEKLSLISVNENDRMRRMMSSLYLVWSQCIRTGSLCEQRWKR